MKTTAIVTSFLMTAGFGSTGHAGNICDVVLQSKAFNTFENTTVSNLMSEARRDVCKTEWHSESEFESRMSGWSAGFSYGGLFGGSAGSSSGSNSSRMKDDYHNFCESSESSLVKKFYSMTKSTIATEAVNEWGRCISTVSGAYGVFSQLKSVVNPTSKSQSAVLQVYYKTTGNTFELLPPTAPPREKLKCSFGARMPLSKRIAPASIGVGNPFILTCVRSATSPLKTWDIAINTNLTGGLGNETIGPYKLLSANDQLAAETALVNLDQQLTTDDLVRKARWLEKFQLITGVYKVTFPPGLTGCTPPPGMPPNPQNLATITTFPDGAIVLRNECGDETVGGISLFKHENYTKWYLHAWGHEIEWLPDAPPKGNLLTGGQATWVKQ